jgi:hypothetical protein
MIYDGFHVHVRKMNIASQTLGKFFLKNYRSKIKKNYKYKIYSLDESVWIKMKFTQ